MDVSRLGEELATGSGPTIICAQAGEINTGAFDALDEIAASRPSLVCQFDDE
jgi:hypothetical protein